MQKAVRGVVSLWTVILWNEETRPRREKCPLPSLSRTSSIQGMRSWPRMLMLFNFLELIASRIPPDLFGMMTTGLAYGDVERCVRPVARCSSKTAPCCSAKGDSHGTQEVTGGLSGGIEILNGRREHEPKSVDDLEGTSANSIKMSPSWVLMCGS